MKKKVIIIGGDGHGSLIASCIEDNIRNDANYPIEIAGFLNDFDENVDGYPVLGKWKDIDKFIGLGYYFAWGVHLITRNYKTYQIFKTLQIPEDRLVTIVHHTASLGKNVVLEHGVSVLYGADIAPRTHIGICSMIKAQASVGHDVECGPLCHIARGAIVGSFTKLGICADVSLGTITLEHINIGDYAMLGAGALGTRDIPKGEIHIGRPAKFHKKMKED